MTSPRRILFCSQAAHVGGGVEVWLDDVAAGLSRRGWDVHVALARGRFHDPSRYLEQHPHQRVHELDGTSGLREQRMLSLIRTFDRLRPSIVFPVNLADALYATAYWKQRNKDATVRIVTCIQKIKDDAMIMDLRACSGFLDLATTISRRVEALLRSTLSLDSTRIVRIPTGVPLPLVEPSPRDHLRSLAYIGRLDASEKRIFDLVALVERIRGRCVTIHVVGSGPAETELKARLADSVRSGEVVFHGTLPRRELYARIYPRVDALILFSKYEAGPMTAWEAMIHGVVPIVSDFGGRQEEGVIRSGVTGLVFPVGDIPAATAAVTEATKPGALLELSKNCRELLPRDYHQSQFEQRWNEELLRVLDMPSRVSGEPFQIRLSPGRIARLGLGLSATYRLRRLFGAKFQHAEAGAEWPHAYGDEAAYRC